MNRLLIALFCFGLTLTGCESKADTDNPKTFDDPEVTFQYPGNWTATAQDVEGGREIQLESPGDAILIVLVMNQRLPVDLHTFANSIIEVRAEEAQALMKAGDVELGEVGETTSKDVTTSWKGGERKAIEQRFTITALGEPVPHVALFHKLDSPQRTGFVMSQVAADDMEKVKPGFQMVWTTIELK